MFLSDLESILGLRVKCYEKTFFSLGHKPKSGGDQKQTISYGCYYEGKLSFSIDIA